MPAGLRRPHALRGMSEPTDDGYDVRALASELGGKPKRLGRHAVHEIERLGREAGAGASPATPAILIAGVALSLWGVVALVIAAALIAAHLDG